MRCQITKTYSTGARLLEPGEHELNDAEYARAQAFGVIGHGQAPAAPDQRQETAVDPPKNRARRGRVTK